MLLARDLNVSIEQNHILKDLNVDAPNGCCLGVIGPNGSGKTTLLRAISGLLPYSGSLKLEGRSLDAWSRQARARAIAVVQQSSFIQFDFSIFDFVLLGRMPHNSWLDRTSREDERRVHTLLQDLHLGHLHHRSLATLSGGERQRVFLAQALIQDPRLLLLDEPTTHLDVYHQFDILSRIRSMVEKGLTVIAVFHDLSLAARFSDRILVLDQGRQITFGSPVDVLNPALVRDVFRMDAHIHTDAEGCVHFHYLRPVHHENLHQNRR